MRYLDLIRERRDSDRKPAQLIVDVVSQRGECDPNAFLEELPLKTDTHVPDQLISVSLERGAKVRTVQPQWVVAWRNLAQLTDGITKDDPQFLSVCDALEKCDRAFEQDKWTVFQQEAESVKRLVEENEIGG